MFKDIYQGRVVLITGHTGFKGSWLTLWLNQLGAKIIGLSLTPNTNPSHFELIEIEKNICNYMCDIRDFSKVKEIIDKHKPEIIFHLAAQPLVINSYIDPRTTFDTNIFGTINILEAVKTCGSVQAVVVITSDKCYENREWIWGYRESDTLGGYDPYSASKACTEIVVNSYRNSFFNHNDYLVKHNILLATVRAGNVIGGGDWAQDRLVPDVMKSIYNNKKVIIRNPKAIRPWQHVLDPLSGYLLLGKNLLEKRKDYAESWNFGPNITNNINVEELVLAIKKHWGSFNFEIKSDANKNHETNQLRLDCSKANYILKWQSNWDILKSIDKTVKWYKEYYENGKIISIENLNNYILEAKNKKFGWIE